MTVKETELLIKGIAECNQEANLLASCLGVSLTSRVRKISPGFFSAKIFSTEPQCLMNLK